MTEAETAVREALAKMTPGIWEWRKNTWLQEIKCGSLNVASSGSKHDAAGIVALRNHTPALLAELDAARAEAARLRLDVRTQEALQDSAYRAGMKFGWNCCDAGADDKYRQAMEGGEYIAELKRIRQERTELEAGLDEQAVATLDSERQANAMLTAEVERLREALTPFARLEIPTRAEGNCGFYSLLFRHIKDARAALEPRT